MKNYLPFFFTILFFSCSGKKDIIIEQQFIFEDAPFSQCHASSIIATADNTVQAVWFGGPWEGNDSVQIWQSFYTKGKWSFPVAIANGIMQDSARYACWNPVLFLSKDNLLHLYYKVGPNPREWWGMAKTSTDYGKTWSAASRLAQGIIGPVKNKPVQLEDGSILSPSSIEFSENNWKAHIERSLDNGKTWQIISVSHQDSFNAIQPSILTYSGNRIQMLCRSREGVITQSWSEDNGVSWSPMTATSIINPNSGTDAVTLKNGKQLLVYNPDIPGKEWFNGRAKLHLAESKDGIEWTDILVLENGDKEEFSYPAIIQAPDNKIHITYTYDRKKIKHVVLSL